MRSWFEVCDSIFLSFIVCIFYNVWRFIFCHVVKQKKNTELPGAKFLNWAANILQLSRALLRLVSSASTVLVSFMKNERSSAQHMSKYLIDLIYFSYARMYIKDTLKVF